MRHSKSGCTAGPQLEGKGATFEPSHGEDEDEYSDRLPHKCYDHDPYHADKDLSTYYAKPTLPKIPFEVS